MKGTSTILLCALYQVNAQVICTKDMCPDGSSRSPIDCSCPTPFISTVVVEIEPVVCTQDLCWDMSPRNPKDCSCPTEPVFCI